MIPGAVQIAFVAAIIPVVACSSFSDERCTLEDEAKQRAGKGAVDCGVVPLGGDRAATDKCAVAAFQAGMPFFARYERQGRDSQVAFGVTFAKDGTVTFLNFDSDPSGGSGSRPVISGSVCEGPKVLESLEPRLQGTPPFSCTSGRSLGRVCD